MVRAAIILGAILFAILPLSGQIYPSRQFTMNDGLPSNSVRSIFIDSRDWMWVGTDAGVSLFEGQRFHGYPGLEELNGKRVWAIAEDEQNRMWFGTYGDGIACFDGHKIKWYDESNGLSFKLIRALFFIEKEKQLIAGTDGGIAIFSSDTCISYTISIKYDIPRVLSFIEVGDSVICIYQGMTEKIVWLPEENRLAREPIDSNHLLWMAYSAHINSDKLAYASVGRNNLRIKIKDRLTNATGIGQVIKFTKDTYGNTWAAAWVDQISMPDPGGLFKIVNDTLEFFNPHLGINANQGYDVLYDERNRCLWFATLDQGLYRIPDPAFTYYPPAYFGLGQLPVNDIMVDSRGALWITSDSAVIKLTDQSRLIISKIDFINIMKNYRNFKRFDGLAEDSKGNIYVNSNIGIFRLSTDNKPVKHYSSISPGHVLFGENDTLFEAFEWAPVNIYYNIDKGSRLPTDNLPIAPKSVNIMARIGKDIWYGDNYKGLYVLNNGLFYHANDDDSNICNVINAIVGDNKGNAIIGANNGEIYIMNFSKGFFTKKYSLGKANGLTGNSVKWLICDNTNNLWIGTDEGLNLISLDKLYEANTYEFSFYDQEEGYRDFTGTKAAVDHEGNIYVSLLNDIMKIDPSLLALKDFSEPKVIISSIDVFNRPLTWVRKGELANWTGIPNISPLLNHNQNYLTFHFSSTNRLNPEKSRFSYRLEGLDTAWTAFGSITKAVYTNLFPGKYNFKVRYKNSHNTKKTIEASFAFQINPPWWQTWWFILICIILGTALVWSIIFLRTSQVRAQVRKKAEVQRQLAELRMQALQAQMNPHFTFNVLTAIQNTILDNKIDRALLYLSDVASLIRKTLENATKKRITLDEEISYLESYLKLEKLRFGNKLSTRIEVDPDINTGEISIPPMLIQPLVENAIKHGIAMKEGEGYVNIIFKLKDDSKVSCIILDNGTGFNKSAQNKKVNDLHISRGLELIRNRLELLNEESGKQDFSIEIREVTDNAEITTLTMIELVFPVNQE